MLAKGRTHNNLIIKTMSNHSTHSCFMIIPINLGFYYHLSWSSNLLLLKW